MSESNTAIVVSGVIRIEPEDREAALAAIEPLVAATLAEPGCIEYGYWADPTDPGRFRVFEQWRSDEALRTHFTTAHMAAFGEALGSIRVLAAGISRFDVTDERPI
jgi:quinol monooxygenase YgiN